MSMYTIITGQVHMDPPLTHLELKDVEHNGHFTEIALNVTTTETETADGTLTKLSASTVSPKYDEERVSNYSVQGELQQLVDKYSNVNGDKKVPRTFSGYFICVYEDVEPEKTMKPKGGGGAADARYVPIIDGVFRYEVVDGKVVKKFPVVTGWFEKDPTS